MLALLRLVPLLLVLACTKKAPIEAPPPPPPDPWPELVCPDGALKVGDAPPQGFHVWCRLQLPSGRWVKEGGTVDFSDAGTLEAEGAYDHDKKVGTWRTYYASGEVHIEAQFEAGQEQGAWVELHENGQKKAEGDMIDGHRVGPWVYWHANGQKRLEGVWVDGVEDGKWLEYREDGSLRAESFYKFGRLISQNAHAE